MELPELEILRRDLDREFGGKKLAVVKIQAASLADADTLASVSENLPGAKVAGVERIGGWLAFRIAGGGRLMLRIDRGARLLRVAPSKSKAAKGKASPPPPDGGDPALVLQASQGQPVHLYDGAGTAVLAWAPGEVTEVRPELAELGLDLVASPVSWVKFGEALMRRKGRLKAILMDDTFVVGIGSRYSDEILFSAGLRYSRTPLSLTSQELRRLHRAAVEVLHDAIKYNGTSVGEDGFVDLSGAPGNYQDHIAVHQRDGEMSPRARGPVVKVRYSTGWTWFCEQTQI